MNQLSYYDKTLFNNKEEQMISFLDENGITNYVIFPKTKTNGELINNLFPFKRFLSKPYESSITNTEIIDNLNDSQVKLIYLHKSDFRHTKNKSKVKSPKLIKRLQQDGFISYDMVILDEAEISDQTEILKDQLLDEE